MVICSRCGELIESGWDYRWHFDQHLDEFDNAEDKQEYINETTRIMSSKFFNNKNDNKTDKKGKNCLLYTSPSPRDRQKSRMPSSA